VAKRTAAAQKAYRDKKRGRPPRSVKLTVEQAPHIFSIQTLINRARTKEWTEATPLGKIKIQLDPAYFRPLESDYWRFPTWICIGGVTFPLQRYEALWGRLDRWLVVEGGKRYGRVYVLRDGRIGCRKKLGLVYRVEQLATKNKKRRTRAKLIAQITGGKEPSWDYVEAHPEYVPARKKYQRRKNYWRKQQLLLHPDYRQQGKEAVKGLCKTLSQKS